MRHSLLSPLRLRFLRKAVIAILDEKIRGCIVECGVWRGGSAGEMGRAMIAQNAFRPMYLFDSFEAMPMPTEDDIDRHGRKAKDLPLYGMPSCEYPLNDCINYLRDTCSLPMEHINIVPGWFAKTMPSFRRQIALLHIDCDFYASVKCCLDHLIKHVAVNGFVIIDDYGHWHGCRRAVNQWFQAQGISIDELKPVGSTAVYWRKQV